MTDKKKQIANDLSRGRSLKKKLSITDDDATKVVSKVVEPTEEQKKKDKEVIRTTMDLPKYIHKAIKVKAAQEEMGLKEYIVSLVKKDLNLQ